MALPLVLCGVLIARTAAALWPAETRPSRPGLAAIVTTVQLPASDSPPPAARRAPTPRVDARPAVAAAEAPPKPARSLWMRVTAYCPCPRCCGHHADGITASGKPVTANGGKFVAADTSILPFGTRVSIPGYNGGRAVAVLDRGGAIRGHRLDVFFPSHARARQWGSRWVLVDVWED